MKLFFRAYLILIILNFSNILKSSENSYSEALQVNSGFVTPELVGYESIDLDLMLKAPDQLSFIERNLYIILAYTRQIELNVYLIDNFLSGMKAKYSNQISFNNVNNKSEQLLTYVKLIIGLTAYYTSIGSLELATISDQIQNIFTSVYDIAQTLPFLQFAISLINSQDPNSILPANPTLAQQLTYISLVLGLVAIYSSGFQGDF